MGKRLKPGLRSVGLVSAGEPGAGVDDVEAAAELRPMGGGRFLRLV